MKPPLLPQTPGDWLACYRFRVLTPDGRLLSPELFGKELGVSGDTVRRWEKNQVAPTNSDLQRISALCRLGPVEIAFLFDAFTEPRLEQTPDRRRFCALAGRLLSSEFPAYVFDSLFYVRAWNSYVSILNLPHYPPMGEHIVESILRSTPPRPRAPDPSERQARWLRDFWFSTANLCGSEPYKRVVSRLAQNPDFCQRWMRLALEPDYDEDRMVLTPFYFDFPNLGRFRASTSVVPIPPNYYFREFIPVDDLGRKRWQDARVQGPATVSILDRIHWADD